MAATKPVQKVAEPAAADETAADTAAADETEQAPMPTYSDFETPFLQALAMAAVQLPQVLAQHRDGSNPEHQKQIANLERVISDGSVNPAVLAMLQEQVESMKPQLSWKQEQVAVMLAVYEAGPQTDETRQLAKDVAGEVLRRSAGTGKGKAAGTGVTRVAGAAKALHLHCLLCDFDQPARRSDSATAPSHIANDIRKHMQDPHKFQFNTKQLEETVRQVIMGDLPRATIRNDAKEPVFQVVPSDAPAAAADAPAEPAAAADNGAAAEPASEPETV